VVQGRIDNRANSSCIEAIQKIAKMSPKDENILLNWFESKGPSSNVVEGFDNGSFGN
jgi:hypothetical protein